jgi:hypothetical protein
MENKSSKLVNQVRVADSIKIRDELQKVVDFLAGHDDHSGKIAWNIKVYDTDITDEVRKEFSLDKKWDKRWEEESEKDYHLHSNACEDGLSWTGDSQKQDYNYIEGHANQELSSSNYEIYSSGRSGGWLELHKFNCSEPDYDEIKGLSTCGVLSFRDYKEKWFNGEPGEDIVEEYLDEYLGDMESYKLLKLFVEEVDKFNAQRELIYQLGFRRQQLEEEWNEEFEDQVMEESFLIMDTAA